jgi:NAD(P)-dependent dehydrogenase (short-subunit alcohol dehydrogenase family)
VRDDGRAALVTGANRGIGREIARQLAALGVTTIVTARDRAKAESAAAELAADGLPVAARSLDVTDPASVARLAKDVGAEPGRLDILVNNAGILLDHRASVRDVDLAVVRETLETNLLGAWSVTVALLPLLEQSGRGRIVNVSTGLAQLADMGGGTPAYRVSKTGLNALTRILAAELRASGVLVNAACPGWVRTDMGGPSAPRSVKEGADTAVWLATLPDDGPTGGFFRDRKPFAW